MKRIKGKYLLYIFLCVIAIVTVIFAYTANHANPCGSKNICFVGKYSTDGERWTQIHTNELKKVNTENIFIKGHFTEEIKKGEHLWAQFHRAIVTITRNGRIIFSNEKALDRPNMPFITEWSDYVSEGLSTSEEITVNIKGKNAGLSAGKFLESVCRGDKIDLLRANLQKHIWQICIAILMISIGMALALTVLALCFTKNKIKKSYIYSGLFLIAGGICTLIDYNYITLLIPNKHLVNTIDYLSQCLICEFLLLYIAAFLENKKLKRISIVISLVMALDIAAYFVLPISMHKYVEAQIPVFIGCIVIAIAFLIYEYFKLHNKKTKPLLFSGAVVSLFIIAEMIKYYTTGEYWIVVFQFGLIVYACMQFFYLVKQANETIQEAHETEVAKRELTEAKIDIMLSQIQPHFLYNSLTSIISLCEDNTEAKKALMDFSKYLRINLDSIKRNTPQPFEMELHHIKTYLSLEKMRFMEKLNVVYNIRTIDFCVPALTIQPLVENAVKYGVCQKNGVGTITITTRETETDYVITVEDDGMGFDINENKEDGRTHIGIDNVKQRLMAMCKAELTIESEINVGTKATVKVPKGVMTNENITC